MFGDRAGSEGVRRRLGTGERGADEAEVPLKTGRRNGDERPCRAAAVVGEGMRDTARGKQCAAGADALQLVADLEGQLALEDEEQLVEGWVQVQRRAVEGRPERFVDEADMAVGLFATEEHVDSLDAGRSGKVSHGAVVVGPQRLPASDGRRKPLRAWMRFTQPSARR